VDKQSVPQDDSPTYGGLRKLLYAVDETGHYTGVPSSGWEAESFATELAVAELERLTLEAWQRASRGEASPLEYHMYRRRMDLDTLVGVTGFWRWRIRRHFRARGYANIPDRVLARYAEALGVTVAELRSLPASP
jgi:hypothetical protein